MSTALSVSLAAHASTTLATADKLYSAQGAPATTFNATQVGTATGYGEITSQGATTAWAAATSIGTPTGNGFFWDNTLLEGQQMLAGNWSAVLRLTAAQGSSPAGTLTADLYLRAYKYSGGTYTLLTSILLSAQTISAIASFTFPATAGSSANFSTGDKLYVDIWANITSNANANSTQAIRLNALSTDTASFTGSSNATITTPGYQPTPAGGSISVSPTSLSYSGSGTSGTNPPAQNIVLTNAGGTDTWTESITYGAGASGWLLTSPTSGSITGGGTETVAVGVSIQGMTLGTYTATLTLSMNGTTATVNVTVTVTPTTVVMTVTELANPATGTAQGVALLVGTTTISETITEVSASTETVTAQAVVQSLPTAQLTSVDMDRQYTRLLASRAVPSIQTIALTYYRNATSTQAIYGEIDIVLVGQSVASMVVLRTIDDVTAFLSTY